MRSTIERAAVSWHTPLLRDVAATLEAGEAGLAGAEARVRLERYGPNGCLTGLSERIYFVCTSGGGGMAVKVRIIPIGNSRGIRIPKAILEQCHLEDHVELQAQEGRLVIRPVETARQGWEEAFRRMAEAGDDVPIDEPTATDWDKTEWRW